MFPPCFPHILVSGLQFTSPDVFIEPPPLPPTKPPEPQLISDPSLQFTSYRLSIIPLSNFSLSPQLFRQLSLICLLCISHQRMSLYTASVQHSFLLDFRILFENSGRVCTSPHSTLDPRHERSLECSLECSRSHTCSQESSLECFLVSLSRVFLFCHSLVSLSVTNETMKHGTLIEWFLWHQLHWYSLKEAIENVLKDLSIFCNNNTCLKASVFAWGGEGPEGRGGETLFGKMPFQHLESFVGLPLEWHNVTSITLILLFVTYDSTPWRFYLNLSFFEQIPMNVSTLLDPSGGVQGTFKQFKLGQKRNQSKHLWANWQQRTFWLQGSTGCWLCLE